MALPTRYIETQACTKKRDYMELIQTHRENVMKIGYKAIDLFKLDYQFMSTRLDNHDMSKFSNVEFYGYVLMLSEDGKTTIRDKPEWTEEEKKKVEEAVAHHFYVNDHHEKFFHDVRVQSKHATHEMVIDWLARSYEFGETREQLAKFIDGKKAKYNYSPQQLGIIDGYLENYELLAL